MIDSNFCRSETVAVIVVIAVALWHRHYEPNEATNLPGLPEVTLLFQRAKMEGFVYFHWEYGAVSFAEFRSGRLKLLVSLYPFHFLSFHCFFLNNFFPSIAVPSLI